MLQKSHLSAYFSPEIYFHENFIGEVEIDLSGLLVQNLSYNCFPNATTIILNTEDSTLNYFDNNLFPKLTSLKGSRAMPYGLLSFSNNSLPLLKNIEELKGYSKKTLVFSGNDMSSLGGYLKLSTSSVVFQNNTLTKLG